MRVSRRCKYRRVPISDIEKFIIFLTSKCKYIYLFIFIIVNVLILKLLLGYYYYYYEYYYLTVIIFFILTLLVHFLMFSRNQRMRDERYRRPEDIERVIQEFEKDDLEYVTLFGDIETDSNDLDYESEIIEDSGHDSDSEIEMENLPERLDENETNMRETFRFFIGKDGETLWTNKPVANISKTKSKNIIKIFSAPKHNARQCKTEIECFSQIISMDIIEKIVFYTNIYIEWRNNANPNSRDRDFKLTD